jgi:hypothetical protein
MWVLSLDFMPSGWSRRARIEQLLALIATYTEVTPAGLPDI